jgi:transposase-like protein
LKVLGVTTDGSPLYPDPIAEIFPAAKHQLCEFHVIKEIMNVVLQALAQVRKEFKRQIPTLPRGRPSTREAKRLARTAERLRKKIGDLFENRHLFVKRDLTDGEKKKLQQITRGRRDLQALRPIVDEVYRLFDRRCRTETALKKLAALRRKVHRLKSVRKALKKLWSPNLEKALTFLDDKLLPATSNAVERANRRHRKMQKTVYRVRTKAHVEARIAMDMLRESREPARAHVVSALHGTRPRAPRIDPRLLKRRRRASARCTASISPPPTKPSREAS